MTNFEKYAQDPVALAGLFCELLELTDCTDKCPFKTICGKGRNGAREFFTGNYIECSKYPLDEVEESIKDIRSRQYRQFVREKGVPFKWKKKK